MLKYSQTAPELYIGRRKGLTQIEKVKISSISDAASFFRKIWDEETLEFTESVMVVYLNKGLKTVGWVKTSSGGIDTCIIDLRTVLAGALIRGATGFMIAHNHPSGNLRPSTADDRITRQLKEASVIMSIDMVDHIIITDEGYFSYKENTNLLD